MSQDNIKNFISSRKQSLLLLIRSTIICIGYSYIQLTAFLLSTVRLTGYDKQLTMFVNGSLTDSRYVISARVSQSQNSHKSTLNNRYNKELSLFIIKIQQTMVEHIILIMTYVTPTSLKGQNLYQEGAANALHQLMQLSASNVGYTITRTYEFRNGKLIIGQMCNVFHLVFNLVLMLSALN